MNEQKNNGRGIFYGVIGVATLVVAIIGATFAYFTATASGANNVITGNMASISFGVQVAKVLDPGSTSGMIPMSNDMVEVAANNNCLDDNGNAVCQVYEITVTNTSSAAMFVDGYVALAGGSGTPTDEVGTENITTMRWAQVFATDDAYSTSGEYQLGGADDMVEYTNVIAPAKDATDATGFNTDNILTDNSFHGTIDIAGTEYATVSRNFIRISDHEVVTEGTTTTLPILSTSFDRTDYTSTLVLSQQLQPEGTEGNVVKYHVLVWLSETGTNQNPAGEGATDTSLAADEERFFNGIVTFNSAQGSEVTATFSGYTAVDSQANNS